jgi:hypothetical protein
MCGLPVLTIRRIPWKKNFAHFEPIFSRVGTRMGPRTKETKFQPCSYRLHLSTQNWNFTCMYGIENSIEIYENCYVLNPGQKYTPICIDSHHFSPHTPVSVKTCIVDRASVPFDTCTILRFILRSQICDSIFSTLS